MTPEQVTDILKLAWPIIVFQVALQIYAIIDIARKKKTRNLTPAIWIVIVLLGEILGVILYFLLGKAED